MNIVTGFRNEPHVTAEDMRVLIRSVYGNSSAITAIGEKLEPELISNNEVRIHDGAIVQQGCFGRIEANTYEVMTIDNGSQDMNRIDLIVSRYEMNADTGIESMTLKLIKGEETEGTPIAPSHVTGSIEDGDLIDEFPLFQINLQGITVTSVDRLAEPLQTVYAGGLIGTEELTTVAQTLTGAVNELDKAKVLTSDMIWDNTYTNSSQPREQKCLKIGHTVTFAITFTVRTVLKDNVPLISGLPRPYGSTLQFTGMNVTQGIPISMAIHANGYVTRWYGGQTAVGDVIRCAFTYLTNIDE